MKLKSKSKRNNANATDSQSKSHGTVRVNLICGTNLIPADSNGKCTFLTFIKQQHMSYNLF
jgi:hypothetical protein